MCDIQMTNFSKCLQGNKLAIFIFYIDGWIEYEEFCRKTG